MQHGPQWVVCFAAALCCPAFAADPAGAPPSGTADHGPWTGSAELGGVATTGNTETSSLDAKFKLNYARGPWTDTARLGTLHVSSLGTTTANRTFGSLDSKYALAPSDFVFANLRGTHDQFSGYSYQASASLGIGRLLAHTRRVILSTEIGAGYRQSRLIGGPTGKEPILRLHGKFQYRFSRRAHFSQKLTAIAGSQNTELEVVSGLTTSITGALALKVSYTVLHNSKVSAGLKKTDTFTSINLVDHF